MKRKVELEGGPLDGKTVELETGAMRYEAITASGQPAIYVTDNEHRMRFGGYRPRTECGSDAAGDPNREFVQGTIGSENTIMLFIYVGHYIRGCSEGVLAHRLGDDTAKVVSIPFYARDFSQGAIVRFDGNHEISEVLEYDARTVELYYATRGSNVE